MHISLMILLAAIHPLTNPLLFQAGGQQSRTAPQTAEGVVRELYDLVSFQAGGRPDWDQVRAAFLEEAVVVLRTSPEDSTLFSLDGFIEDFTGFVDRMAADRLGFQERVLSLQSQTFGDTAHILVLYEASVPGSSRPPQQGLDNFLLIRKEGSWKIVAVVNELRSRVKSLPPELR